MNITKVDLTSKNQKIFAGILLVISLLILYYILPPIIVILTNLWIAAILVVPIIFMVMNPMLIWNIYKQLSWKLTKKLISGDKLGYMYRYHEHLLSKIKDLDVNIKNVSSIRIGLQRRVGELNNNINNNKQQALLYEQKKSPNTVIRVLANKINIDTKQLESLLPKVVSVEKQENYLKELYENWLASAEDLLYTLDAKADEYKLLKELSIATGNASEFLKGDSEEFKLYQESLNQIEISVTQYTANVEDFERKIKPTLDNLSMGKMVSEDAGLKLIEEFKKNSQNLRMIDNEDNT